MNTELYVQDNWRVKRNFTIDAGVRFYYITPTQSQGDEVAQFEPERLERGAGAAAVSSRVSTAQGRARRVNPLTGEILPLVYIGRLVPDSGNFTNGMQVYDGTPQQKIAVPGRAAHRVRLGRHGRRQDRRPRRRRRVLRSVLGRQHPRSDRAAAAPADLHDQLHDVPELLAQPADGDDRPPCGGSTSSCRRSSTTGASACSATSAGTWSATWPTSATPRATSWSTVRSTAGRTATRIRRRAWIRPTSSGGIAQPLPDDLLRPYRGYA